LARAAKRGGYYRFLRALAALDAKRFSARYSRGIGVGSLIAAFPTASSGD
jgi:hypothetical protein